LSRAPETADRDVSRDKSKSVGFVNVLGSVVRMRQAPAVVAYAELFMLPLLAVVLEFSGADLGTRFR